MKKFLKSEKIAFEKLKYEENINWKNKNETLNVTEKVQFIYSSNKSYIQFFDFCRIKIAFHWM